MQTPAQELESVRCVSIRDAAALTTLSRRTIVSLIAAGQLAAVKVGRRRVIPLTAVKQLVSSAGRAA